MGLSRMKRFSPVDLPVFTYLRQNMKPLLTIALSLLLLAPANASSPAPEPEPEIPMEKALELAKAHTREKKIDLSAHYLDRVWIGYQEGKADRRWIVSWSPKPERRTPGTGWIILKVKLDGTVTDEAGAVPWLSPNRVRLLPPNSTEPMPNKGDR
jgi:hypothetical protein